MVHHKRLLGVFLLEPCKSLENLRNVHIVDFVHFDQVLEQHEDVVRKQPGLAAEVRILELGEDLSDQRIKVSVVFEDLACGERTHVVRDLAHLLAQDVGFVVDLHIQLYVVRVRLADFSVHFDVVLALVLARSRVAMQQVFLRLQFLVNFTIHLYVLHAAVERDQDLHVDRPVV